MNASAEQLHVDIVQEVAELAIGVSIACVMRQVNFLLLNNRAYGALCIAVLTCLSNLSHPVRTAGVKRHGDTGLLQYGEGAYLMYLLDTGILIRHLCNVQGYRELMEQLDQQGDLWVSACTRVEILRGMRNHEEQHTAALLASLLTQVIDQATADRAGLLIRLYQSRGAILQAGDMLIGAGVLQLGAPLVTTIPRHFPMPELAVLGVDVQGTGQYLPPERRV
ncbi:MAG: PIN domain-containing protein [Caldilinea sp.]